MCEYAACWGGTDDGAQQSKAKAHSGNIRVICGLWESLQELPSTLFQPNGTAQLPSHQGLAVFDPVFRWGVGALHFFLVCCPPGWLDGWPTTAT